MKRFPWISRVVLGAAAVAGVSLVVWTRSPVAAPTARGPIVTPIYMPIVTPIDMPIDEIGVGHGIGHSVGRVTTTRGPGAEGR